MFLKNSTKHISVTTTADVPIKNNYLFIATENLKTKICSAAQHEEVLKTLCCNVKSLRLMVPSLAQGNMLF